MSGDPGRPCSPRAWCPSIPADPERANGYAPKAHQPLADSRSSLFPSPGLVLGPPGSSAQTSLASSSEPCPPVWGGLSLHPAPQRKPFLHLVPRHHDGGGQ